MAEQGQENQDNKVLSSDKTSFTFSCETETPMPTTSPWQRYPDARLPASPQADSIPTPHTLPSHPPRRKTRQPLSKIYALAAKERRLRQNYNNFHHPPRREDVWICQYCEYERFFGRPPDALVRLYEIKDRRERRRLAEKRRLLEKARMKGKKTRKGSKGAAKPLDPDLPPVDGMPDDEPPGDEEHLHRSSVTHAGLDDPHMEKG